MLGVIVYAQAIMSLRLRNDVFIDEASYIVAGRLQLGWAVQGDAQPHFASYFSGAPFLYPPLAAIADRLGGLAAARSLSLAFMVVATLCVLATARRLFGRDAGYLAALVFAVQAPVAFVGHLATFDAPSVACLAVAMWAAVRARGDAPWRDGLGVGLAVGLATLFKYASLLYAPVFVALLWWDAGSFDDDRRRAVRRVAACALGALGVWALATAVAGPELVRGFVSTTLARREVSGGDALGILRFAAQLGGALALLAALSFVGRDGCPRSVKLVLLGAALLAPLHHARIHEYISLHKHVAFGALFAAPLAGRVLSSGIQLFRRFAQSSGRLTAGALGAACAAVVLRFALVPGIEWSERLFRFWPTATARAFAAVRPLAKPEARFLSEEPDIGAYLLGDSTRYDQWASGEQFRYAVDGDRALTGAEAHVAAIRDGYFDAVLLRYGSRREWARRIARELTTQGEYQLAHRFRYRLDAGPGVYEVWVRSPGGLPLSSADLTDPTLPAAASGPAPDDPAADPTEDQK